LKSPAAGAAHRYDLELLNGGGLLATVEKYAAPPGPAGKRGTPPECLIDLLPAIDLACWWVAGKPTSLFPVAGHVQRRPAPRKKVLMARAFPAAQPPDNRPLKPRNFLEKARRDDLRPRPPRHLGAGGRVVGQVGPRHVDPCPTACSSLGGGAPSAGQVDRPARGRSGFWAERPGSCLIPLTESGMAEDLHRLPGREWGWASPLICLGDPLDSRRN